MPHIIERILLALVSAAFLAVAVMVAAVARLLGRRSRPQPRLVWGTTPIINFSYWSKAMTAAGFDSVSLVKTPFSINRSEDWDILLDERFRVIPKPLRPYLAFLFALLERDVFFMSFNGFLGMLPGRRAQPFLLSLAGKKTVLLPYGSDAYVYRRVRDPLVAHALMMSYPGATRDQRARSRVIDSWCEYADAVLPGLMAFDGIGRWDVLHPSMLTLDLETWNCSKRRSAANGWNGAVNVVHAPNHRGFKGTEYVIQAIDSLKEEGLQVNLILLEGVPNSQVRHVLSEEADILVEQLLFSGHGLNALEGMASGLPVISNLSDRTVFDLLRWYTFFDECPIVSGTPADLRNVLRELVTTPELRIALGVAGREYVEKYHGADSAVYLFTRVLDYIYGEKCALENLYHPLVGEYPNRSPRIDHPLKQNCIQFGHIANDAEQS